MYAYQKLYISYEYMYKKKQLKPVIFRGSRIFCFNRMKYRSNIFQVKHLQYIFYKFNAS